jgi:protein-S-isoprenylcysteine O-methyltransferase Ste14
MSCFRKVKTSLEGQMVGDNKSWIYQNRSIILNIYLFINVIGFIGLNTYKLYRKGTLDYVDIGFIAQNLVLSGVILVRRKHQAFNQNWFHQLIAIIAFFSGIAFIGQSVTAQGAALVASRIIILTANIFGIMSLLNLGKSFGILIAFRKVKSNGLYSLVRHPMYATDILLRLGFVISHFNHLTAVLFVLSTSCYVYRAILEERFLIKQPEYKIYMDKVRYRFIPYLL